MNWKDPSAAKLFSASCVALVASLFWFGVTGCNFVPSGRKDRDTKPAAAAAARDSSDPGIDLNCIFDRIQNPPEAFHYSYKHVNGNDDLDEEGDLTPQTADGTFKNKYVSRSFHAVRSDRDSWQAALASLSAVSGASSTFALVAHSSATTRDGAESVNGYDAIRYSIDTARATVAETTLDQNILGPGGSVKGTVWATSQGCPVKFVVDSEMHLNDGTMQKDHYEEAIVKK